jgi:hypothetical protein
MVLWYALYKGLWQPLAEEWRKANAKTRRSMITGGVIQILILAVFSTLLITSPFGPNSFGYVIGGTGVLLFAWLNLFVLHLARRNVRGR